MTICAPAGATNAQEDIARPYRRRSNIASHGYIQPKMHEPHHKAAQRQIFAPHRVGDNAARPQNGRAKRIDLRLVDPSKHPIQLRKDRAYTIVGCHIALQGQR
jgi:hypothetical protein